MARQPRHLNLQQVQNLQYHICVIIFPCVVRKSTAHIRKKALNMRHKEQKCFRGIFVGIIQHQKWYLVYIRGTISIIYSYDVVFDDFFSSMLEYTSQPYAEAMNICL